MTIITFSNPEFFLLLLLLPLLLYAHKLFYKTTKKHALIFSNFETLKRVRKDTKLRAHYALFISRLIVFCLLIAVLAGPTVYYEADLLPTDYVLAIDVSASMTATDIQPTRFEAAKNLSNEFINNLEARTAIGVVAFSGYPTIAQTLTNNTQELTAAINQLTIPPVSGTDIPGAIITATNVLLASNQGRAIILITDGTSTVGLANFDNVGRAINYAQKNSVTIHAIGIGQEAAAPIGYLPRLYNVTAVYSEEEITRLTSETGGKLFTATTTQDFEAAFKELQEEPRSRQTSTDPSIALLLIITLFLFIEWAVMNSRLRILP
ncbi:MAG: VWA domain-containing protein [Candidatus Woesearchaeota archaeon]